MQPERMQNKKYRSWLKSSLSLYYVKQAVTDFAQNESLTLHNHLRNKVQQRLTGQGVSTLAPCTTCTSKSIKRTFDSRTRCVKWQMNCGTCSIWLEELLMQHAHWPSCAHVNWDNTDPTLWSTDPWEVAKVYQPQGCKNHSCSNDADVAALLALITNCKLILSYTSNQQNVHEVRSIRNLVMHSSSLEVEDVDLKAWTKSILSLLEDPKHFLGLTACKEAVLKITELQNNQLDVSLHKELETTALQQRKEATKQDLNNLETLIREVESEMDKKINLLKEDVDNVKLDVQKVKDDNEQITTQVHALDTRQTVTLRKLSLLDTQVQENEEILQLCVKNVDEVVKRTNRASTADDTLKRAIKKVDLCQKDIKTEWARLEDEKKCLKLQSKTLDEVFSKTEQHLECLVSLGEKLSSIKQDEFQPELHDRRLDITSVQCQHIKYLQRSLIDIYNQHCQRIPVCPLLPEDKKHVDKIYVQPEIQVIEPSQNKTNLEAENEEKQTMYTKIFYNGHTECKKVYIIGESGVGKTAFCEKMVSVWCRVHSEDGPTEKMSDDERIMSNFPLMFYLSLKEASTEGSVQEMIQTQLLKDDQLDHILPHSKCLVILDGLDEWDHITSKSLRFQSKGVPNMPLTTNCTVLTTTRPWKLESLRLQMDEIDKQVKIVGLNEKSREELAMAVMQNMCTRKHRNEYADFESALVEDNLKHFTSVPLVLLQLLCLWCDNKPFGNSQCDIYSNMIDQQLKMAEQSKDLVCNTGCEVSNTPKLPKCFKHNKICKTYRRTLFSLSKFAFYTLFSDFPTSTITVDHLQREIHALSKEDLEVGLVSGLLTQNKAESTYTERRKSINFVHKTYQEFFAAMHIVTLASSPDLNKVFKVCCSVDKILEISDVFLFVFGMSSQVGSSLLQHLLKVCSDDGMLINGRVVSADQTMVSTSIVKIQKLTMNILEESERNGQKKLQLQLEDLKVDHRNLAQTSKHLHNVKTKCVKSLTMTTNTSSYKQKVEYSRIFEKVSKTKTLEKLCLIDSQSFIVPDNVYKLISQCKQTLKSLRLEFVNLSKLSENVLNVMKLHPLVSLSLRYVFMTHKQICTLLSFQGRNSSKRLREIDIEGLRCIDHGPWEKCTQGVDLSQLKIKTLRLADMDIDSFRMEASELEKIELTDLQFPGSVSSILRCLENAKRLEEFQCSWCKGESDVERMVQTLPKLANLKRFEISRTDLMGRALRLSPAMKNLDLVELKIMSITQPELMQFIHSIPNNEHRINVRLDEISIINETGEFLQYIRESPRFTLLTSGDCINFHTNT